MQFPATTMAMNENNALADELTSINAIYPDSLLADGAEYTLALPMVPVSLKLSFPPHYPSAPPVILGASSAGDGLKRGLANEVVESARAMLRDIRRPGEPYLFDLILELEARFEHLQTGQAEADQDAQVQDAVPEPGEQDAHAHFLELEPPWVMSAPIEEKKSVFLARAAPVKSRDEARLYLSHLVSTDKKAARATHNISAWRIRGEGAALIQDCDDDGETAAGGRVLHLLHLMDVWDVMVVVSRWYGGVMLGPDRFRLINAAARDALVQGGWAEEKSKRK